MASEDGVDIHESEAEFLDRWALLLARKFSARRELTAADAERHAVAEWPDFHDDIVVAAQAVLRLIYRGSGSPEGQQSAPPGAVWIDTDSPSTGLYRKATGTGNTGWQALGGALEAGSVQIDRLEDIATDTVLGRATASSGPVEQLSAPSFGRSLLAAASAAAARTLLGLGTAALSAASAFAAAGAIASSGLTQATARLLGRTTASSGAVEEIQVDSPLTFSSGHLGLDVTAIDVDGSVQRWATRRTIDFSAWPATDFAAGGGAGSGTVVAGHRRR